MLRLQPVLSEEQFEKIDNTALTILKDVGMKVPHSQLLQILSSRKGVVVAGEIIKFDPRLVKELVQDITVANIYDNNVVAGAYSCSYHDPESDEIRPPTKKDLIRSIKQADALGFGVCAPVVPLDISGPRIELVMERLTHEYARFSYGGGQATHTVTAEASLEMSQAVGRPHGLELWVNSPLTFDAKNLDTLWNLRHRKHTINIVSVPVLGMSTPFNISSIIAQSTAECWGAVALLKCLDLANPLAYRNDAFVMYTIDMQSGNVLLSGPDYIRLLVLATENARRHGIAVPAAKSICTGAKRPGSQAGAEKAAQCLAALMAGAEVYLGLGSLCVDAIFSPIQMMIDREIIGYVAGCVKPFSFDDTFAMNVIKEIGPGGTFMDHVSTVEHMREMWRPQLFSQNALSGWLAEGSPSVEQRAREMLRALELSDAPVVSLDIQKELSNIEERYTKILGRQ